MEYQYADLSNRLKTEIKRLETQISRDTGRRVVLIAYEGGVQPTPVFGDVLESAPPNSSATSSDRAADPRRQALRQYYTVAYLIRARPS